MLGLLLAAIMARGLRPKEATDASRSIPGVVTSYLRRAAKRREWRETIAALRAMPVYETKAERNKAKARRRALRAAGR